MYKRPVEEVVGRGGLARQSVTRLVRAEVYLAGVIDGAGNKQIMVVAVPDGIRDDPTLRIVAVRSGQGEERTVPVHRWVQDQILSLLGEPQPASEATAESEDVEAEAGAPKEVRVGSEDLNPLEAEG